MTVNAIIAEYNPFHNGHVFQLQNAKEATQADYTIVLMSGNYVQRGGPAIIDKHTRTAMALAGGADLVLELPTTLSASSAEYFGSGAVELLSRLGVVDYLCFGSEAGDLQVLDQIASILLEEPESYRATLKESLEAGMSYPLARNAALFKYAPELLNSSDILNSPNNILAIEYLKALKRKQTTIKPYTTVRMGNGYHNKYITGSYCSALAIREAILSGSLNDTIYSQIPERSGKILQEYLEKYRPVTTEDFSDMLFYRLASRSRTGNFADYLDISADLSNRITNELRNFQSFDQFCNLLKTKEITYARISRCLMHILLEIKSEELNGSSSKLPYIRVLGFKKRASALLTAIDNKSSVKMVTKVASAKETLSTEAYEIFEKQLYRDSIYEYVRGKKAGIAPANEFTTPICIL